MCEDDLTKAVQRLEELFGKPSRNTLGASVFVSDSPVACKDLEAFAKSKYQHFVGDAWESIGPENWTATWELQYHRPEGVCGDILKELVDLEDPATSLAASQLTENHDDAQGAALGLQGVFDSPEIQDVSIYRIGDTEAITGVLVAGILRTGNAIALVFLMD
jgi:hypothetical protein